MQDVGTIFAGLESALYGLDLSANAANSFQQLFFLANRMGHIARIATMGMLASSSAVVRRILRFILLA
jgi:hypothetical protein